MSLSVISRRRISSNCHQLATLADAHQVSNRIQIRPLFACKSDPF